MFWRLLTYLILFVHIKDSNQNLKPFSIQLDPKDKGKSQTITDNSKKNSSGTFEIQYYVYGVLVTIIIDLEEINFFLS